MALLNYQGKYGRTDGPIMAAPVKSMASILAIVCAIGSFMVANAAGKFSLAVAGVLLGLVGLARALSPRVSGGILSILAITIAVIGLLAAILDTVGLF
jgi:hypothetical protein